MNVDKLTNGLLARASGRSEADVQSDIRTLLLYGDLDLEEAQIASLEVSTQDGTRRRIDIEIGLTVIEVKNDLRAHRAKVDGETQLAGYIKTQSERLDQRYVGILSDGVDWYLYHLQPDGSLKQVSEFHLTATNPDVMGLHVWLEGVLATSSNLRPTPQQIENRLGANSSAYALDYASLAALYEGCRNDPEVQLKRELWAKLLRTAFGTHFIDADQLFVGHSLLVVSAEILAHAVVGYDLHDPALTPATLITGHLFFASQIHGVVESDFFDWVIDAKGGPAFVAALAKRLARFNWSDVEHDVLKVLYESIISAKQRHDLGEYYTPDWLADRMVSETIDKPLVQRVLDPSCGSGTFLFHAVRRYLDAADQADLPNARALEGLTHSVFGVDVHPVAVTLARVTYLLAIGTKRLQAADRGSLSIPVYLGDTLQWTQNTGTLSQGEITINTTEDEAPDLFSQDYTLQLVFPERVLADAGRFDELVATLADKSASRTPGDRVPSLNAVFANFAVHPNDRPILESTFRNMCVLHDRGRNHVWGYYVRNVARPVWLSREENNVDVLIGNPPWLSYRYMTAEMQKEFKARSESRGLWAGRKVATHQDLSAYFVVRAVELYLKGTGKFAFVMPYAVLSRQQYDGFRTGNWASMASGTIKVQFEQAWDLDGVKPSIFPVPSAVLLGRRSSQRAGVPLSGSVCALRGLLPRNAPDWATAKQFLQEEIGTISVAVHCDRSPYASRFAQGANIVPRVLLCVEDAPASPLGAGMGRRAVRSYRTNQEKQPWKGLESLQEIVESNFVRRMHLGSTIVPFRAMTPWLAVVPHDGRELLDGSSAPLDLYPGLAKWWRKAEEAWNENRSAATRLSLREQIDYQAKLRNQFPTAPHRVVYSKSGTVLAAARVSDPRTIIDHTLYWAAARSTDEARYLCSTLNSKALLERVAPLQSRGAFGERHFDKYVFAVQFPEFDPDNDLHVKLASLGLEAELAVASLSIDEAIGFQRNRQIVRSHLVRAGISAAIDAAVEDLLLPTPSENRLKQAAYPWRV